MELTRELVGEHASFTDRVETVGASRTERLVSLVLLGDLVSVYLAALRGVDPAEIAPISRLKAAMAGVAE
jgi:glucose/mannose-6-phosphate isomerase